MDIIEEMETLEKVEVWLVKNEYPTELSKLHILAVISAMEEIFGWIKIEDQLPKDGQKVIYYFEHTGIHCGHYTKIEYPKEFTGSDKPVYGNQFGGYQGFLTDDVTHWMPLPEPPVSETPLLDQLESGPWPSFVEDMKKNAVKFHPNCYHCHHQSAIIGCDYRENDVCDGETKYEPRPSKSKD